jgi:RimJ/RimL family protein N-acetyltransferase
MSIVEKETVSLQFYSPEYKGLLENYCLLNEQKKYTAFPLDALQKCETEPDRHPVLILYGDHPAGFFVLHGWEGVKEYSDNEHGILLRAYSVNSAFQGNGIATDSMRLLPLFIKENFQQKNEIILAVNNSNLIAQNVYKKGGFIDKGIRAMGREGEMLILHLDV